jgi:aminoglycoside 6-adenylyltransferase
MMFHSPERFEQHILERLTRWGRARDDVRAIVVTSSRASPLAPIDALSDFDPIIVVTEVRPYYDDRGWLGDFGPVLVVYRDPIRREDRLETFGYVTQYENGLKIDFTLWPVPRLAQITTQITPQITAAPTLPDEFDAGYRVLLDKDGLTVGWPPPTFRAYIPAPPAEADYLTRVELFFHEATYVAKYLWRDDLVAARHILENGMLQANLYPMLVWRSEIDHGWTVKPGQYGRRLKRWLRPELWVMLEATYVNADVAANWEAMFRMIDLFRKVAVEVASVLGFSYPHALDERAVRYLRRVQALDRDAPVFFVEDV